MDKVLLSHPTGNANVKNVAKGFADAKILEHFYTSIAMFENSYIYNLSKKKAFTELRRRQFDESLKVYTSTWPWYEAARLLAIKAKLHKLTAHEKGMFSIDNVYNTFDYHVAVQVMKYGIKKIQAVYAYEDGAAFSFEAAKKLGIQCLYDLPIGYWRAARTLLATEQERWPQWQATLTGFRDSPKKLERKDKELELADQIFVASSFTASTLAIYPGKLPPIAVIPYGFPPPYKEREFISLVNRPLKLLFVGGLSQRKGIADLFAAVEKLNKQVSLTIIGQQPIVNCKALNQALKKHQWIPSLPHEQILKTMREHDILVFPSLFEGFGLVITEAMSQGTPVITTNRTAGPDVIADGKNGWLIEAASTLALQQRIEYLLNHPDEIASRGISAMEAAANRPWSVYGKEIAIAVGNYLKGIS